MSDLPQVVPGQAVLWDVSNAEYHGTNEAVGSSMIKCFRASPARYHGMYVTGTIPRKPPTLDMQLGSWTHCLVLEPDQFDSLFALEPQLDRRTKEGKAAYVEWQLDNVDKELISKEHAEQLQKARDMAGAVLAHPLAASLLASKGRTEQGILWRDPVTGILCKARPDHLSLGGCNYPIDVSLKTAADPTEDGFARQTANLDYYVQSALYADAIQGLTGQPSATVHIAVGKEAPYDVWCWRMPPKWLELGRRKLRDALCRLQICQETGEWLAPGQDDLNDLPIPRYLERTLETI